MIDEYRPTAIANKQSVISPPTDLAASLTYCQSVVVNKSLSGELGYMVSKIKEKRKRTQS